MSIFVVCSIKLTSVNILKRFLFVYSVCCSTGSGSTYALVVELLTGSHGGRKNADGYSEQLLGFSQLKYEVDLESRQILSTALNTRLRFYHFVDINVGILFFFFNVFLCLCIDLENVPAWETFKRFFFFSLLQKTIFLLLSFQFVV